MRRIARGKEKDGERRNSWAGFSSLLKSTMKSVRGDASGPQNIVVDNNANKDKATPVFPRMRKIVDYDGNSTDKLQNSNSYRNNQTPPAGNTRMFSPQVRRYPTHQLQYSNLGQFPVVKLHKPAKPRLTEHNSTMVRSPVTVKVAPPDVLKPPPPVFVPVESNSNSTPRTTNPCDAETVLSALREKRKRTNPDDNRNAASPEHVQTSKKRRQNSGGFSYEHQNGIAPSTTTGNSKRRASQDSDKQESTDSSTNDRSKRSRLERAKIKGARNPLEASFSSSKRWIEKQVRENSLNRSRDSSFSVDSRLGAFDNIDSRPTSRPTSNTSSPRNSIALDDDFAMYERSNLSTTSTPLASGRSTPVIAETDANGNTKKRVPLLRKDGLTKRRLTPAQTDQQDFAAVPKLHHSITMDDYDTDRKAEAERLKEMMEEIQEVDKEKKTKSSTISEEPQAATSSSTTGSTTTSLTTTTLSTSLSSSTSTVTSSTGLTFGAQNTSLPSSQLASGAQLATSSANSLSLGNSLASTSTTNISLTSSVSLSASSPSSKPLAAVAAFGSGVQLGTKADTVVSNSNTAQGSIASAATSSNSFKPVFGGSQTSVNTNTTPSVSSTISSAAPSSLTGGFSFQSTTPLPLSSATSVAPSATSIAPPKTSTVSVANTGMTFGASSSSTTTQNGGFTFGSVASSTSSSSVAPSAAPKTTTTSTISGEFSFGQTAKVDQPTSNSTGFSIEQTSSAPVPGGFSFGQTNTTSQSAGQTATSISTTSSSSGFSFGQTAPVAPTSSNTSGFSFGQTDATVTTSSAAGLTFGQTSTSIPTTSSVGFNLNQLPVKASTATSNSSGGLFAFGANSTTTAPAAGFGSSAPAFGQANNATSSATTNSGAFTFGTTQGSAPTATTTASGFGFGQTSAATTSSSSGFAFGQNTAPQSSVSTAGGFGFGQPNTQTSTTAPGFGQPTAQANSASGGFSFGQNTAATTSSTSSFTFGQPAATTAQSSTGFAFGASTTTTPSAPAFGSQPTAPSTGFAFGQNTATTTAQTTNNSTFTFGANTNTATSTAPSSAFQFGAAPANNTTANTSSGFNFGAAPAKTNTQTAPSFGSSTNNNSSSNLFQFGAAPSTNNPAPSSGFGSTGGFGGAPSGGSNAFGSPPQAQTGGSAGVFQFGSQQNPAAASPSFNFSAGNPNPSGLPQPNFGTPPQQAPGMFSMGTGGTAPRRPASRTAARRRGARR